MSNEMIFSSAIYPEACVSYAAERYKDIAEIDMTRDGGGIKCRFGNCVYGTAETMNEFGNFVIEVMFSRVCGNGAD